MSYYVRYYNKNQNLYRHFAIMWAEWSKTTELSETVTHGISSFFKPAAKRFGLVTEFRQLGILQKPFRKGLTNLKNMV